MSSLTHNEDFRSVRARTGSRAHQHSVARSEALFARVPRADTPGSAGRPAGQPASRSQLRSALARAHIHTRAIISPDHLCDPRQLLSHNRLHTSWSPPPVPPSYNPALPRVVSISRWHPALPTRSTTAIPVSRKRDGGQLTAPPFVRSFARMPLLCDVSRKRPYRRRRY